MIFTGRNLSRIQLKMTPKHSSTHNVPSFRTGWSNHARLLSVISMIYNFYLTAQFFTYLLFCVNCFSSWINRWWLISNRSKARIDTALLADTIHFKVYIHNNRALLIQDWWPILQWNNPLPQHDIHLVYVCPIIFPLCTCSEFTWIKL